DVLSGIVDAKKAFNGKMVFVGGTAAALFDIKAIPYKPIYFGVLIHANILDNLIAKNYMHEAPVTVSVFSILLVGIWLGLILYQLSPLAKLASFVALVAAIFGVELLMFDKYHYVAPMVAPLLVVVGCYGGMLFYRLVIEEREKRKIKGSFKQYLSPKIIEIIT